MGTQVRLVTARRCNYGCGYLGPSCTPSYPRNDPSDAMGSLRLVDGIDPHVNVGKVPGTWDVERPGCSGLQHGKLQSEQESG